MRFYDMIMQDKYVPTEEKNKLDGVPVIVADNVSSYYFEGTDKERWDLSDFPNVAPPFEHFWLECKAPLKMVSVEHGTLPWYSNMPTYWGFYVSASLVESIPQALSTEVGRQRLIEDLEEKFSNLHRSIVFQVPNYFDLVYNGGMEKVKEKVTEKEYTMIAEIMDVTETITHIINGDYDKAESALMATYSYKWLVHVDLWQRMNVERANQILPKCWGWDMCVQSDGSVLNNRHTGIPMIISVARQPYSNALEVMLQEGISYDTAIQMIDNSLHPSLHTLLLSMSFLHCRNVNLDTVSPPKRVVHNKSAKKRGEKSFQPVQFKILDIKPMRQVLKTEGQEDTLGTQKALHICRGHFKHYEEGRGLFGRHHGTFWFPQHTRGTVDKGTVVKDYRLHTP